MESIQWLYAKDKSEKALKGHGLLKRYREHGIIFTTAIIIGTYQVLNMHSAICLTYMFYLI